MMIARLTLKRGQPWSDILQKERVKEVKATKGYYLKVIEELKYVS